MDRELAEEMAEHLAEKLQQLRAEGHDEATARMLASRQFGNMTLQLEDSRAGWGWNVFERTMQDVRFSCRVLAKAPGFAATAVLVLGLGIGINTAMFSAVKAVLLSALPYPAPEQIVELRQTAKNGHMMNVSGLDFQDWRAQSRSVEYMATYGSGEATISGSFAARSVRMAEAGKGFFEAMGTQAAIGRTFDASEQKPGGSPTLVVGYELAQSLFGVPGAAIQQAVRLNGLVFTIIGVMPPRFSFPEQAQLWLPNDLFPDESARSAHNYRVIGRLRSGVTVSQAQADMDVVAARLGSQYIDDKDEGIRVISLFEYLVSDVRPALLVLWGAVTMVLLIACVNISNLQMARAAARGKEMGLRVALGAGRGRLIWQLLTENILLAVAGGLVGLCLAELAIKLLPALTSGIPRLENLRLDPTVLGFTGGLSLLAGLLFGVLPALQSSGTDVNDALKQATGKGGGAPKQKRWNQTLVVGQIALAIVLLSGAALLVKSYWKLAHVETGLASNSVYFTELTWPAATDGNSVDYATVRSAAPLMLQEVKELRGVQAAAFVHGLPFQGAPDGCFEIEGRALPADPHLCPDALYRTVTADYFKAFDLPILKGRSFQANEQMPGQQIAVVNQAFEKEFFPRGEALGKRIRFMGFDRKPDFMTIIGVVPDVRGSSLRRQATAEVYASYFQHAQSAMDVALVVRGPSNLESRIEKIVTSLNRDTAIHFESMDSLIAGTISRERFQTLLLGLFAACALLLAVIGIYGLLSYTVTCRTSEMGVRMALGASGGSIAWLVLSQGTTLVAAGLAIGLASSVMATRTLQSMLYEVGTNDPAALIAVVAGFGAAALAGFYVPARRASRIEPLQALRTE